MVKIKDGRWRSSTRGMLYANLTSDIMLKLYANSSSDIPKLYAIDFGTPVIEKLKKKINNV